MASLSPGSSRLLRLYVKLGRAPSEQETDAAGVSQSAHSSLRFAGCVADDGSVTKHGADRVAEMDSPARQENT